MKEEKNGHLNVDSSVISRGLSIFNSMLDELQTKSLIMPNNSNKKLFIKIGDREELKIAS